jgi:hypothetical protein
MKASFLYGTLLIMMLILNACGNTSTGTPTSAPCGNTQTNPTVKIVDPDDAETAKTEEAHGQILSFVARANPAEVTFRWKHTGAGTLLTGQEDRVVQYEAPPSVEKEQVIIITVAITDKKTGCQALDDISVRLLPRGSSQPALTATPTFGVTETPALAVTETPTLAVTATPTAGITAAPAVSGSLGINVRSGDQVAQTVTLMGEYSPDFSGDLWVLIVPPSELYYPQSPNACKGEATPRVGNRWELRVGFGGAGDEGVPFDIVLVAADPAASREFSGILRQWCETKKFPGLEKDQLPAGARELGPPIKVTRSAERWGPAPEISNTQLPGQITFTNVADQDLVTQRQNIAGQYTSDVTDKLWVLVHASNGRWYPQSTNACRNVHTRVANGEWQVLAGFGGADEVGQAFDVAVVLADAAANQVFEEQQKQWCEADSYLGFLTIELPQGISEKGRIRVTRR